MKGQLAHYSSFINFIDVEGAIQVMDCSFHLEEDEKDLLGILLENMKLIGERGYKENKLLVKQIKDSCQEDFNNYMKGIFQFSEWNRDLLIEVVKRPKSQERDQLVHTICRLGEFYYLTDEEMNEVTTNIDDFIESGDCKLLDNETNPYGKEPLSNSFRGDIEKFEPEVRRYLRDHDLPDISAGTILQALDKIERWYNSDIEYIPEYLKGYFQLFWSIRRKAKDLLEVWDKGMPEEYMMTKLSGSCLNKEPNFRQFREMTKTSAWKNPETNMFYGNTNINIPHTVKNQLYFIPWWNMDAVYYSIGKGPWLKTRYVGQPATVFQNLCEPGASIVKSCIKSHHKHFLEQNEPGYNSKKYYSAEGINIYDNYERLYSLINRNSDFNSIDYESYSDYLNRNSFEYIMDRLWGFPREYKDLVMSIMALPIRVNGKDYENRHASVMGIKINFLLISFANLLMWMIYTIITGVEDDVIIMGDDRQTGKKTIYTEEEIEIQISVSAYFNCKSNMSKCEWMHRDGYSSFCKRYFNRDKQQISGFSGEYVLKQKPFMLDISNWMKLCRDGEINIREEDQQKWIRYWFPWIETTYYKFWKKGDPNIDELFSVQKKIPYYYGGLSFNEPDDAIEKIMFRSLLSSINSILEYAGEDLKDPRRSKIREWIRTYCKDPIYYDILTRVSSFDKDWDRLRECIESVEAALIGQVDEDTIRKARKASQQLTEIVLQRDSRLANSTSTKNRIDYSFDQDKISKIRKLYLDACLADESFYIESNLIDHAVFNSLMESKNNLAIPDYLTYLQKKAQSKSGLEIYFNYTSSFLAMTVEREGKKFYKRLESSDSDYEHIHRETDGSLGGKFVNFQDLTEEERFVYNYYRQGSTRKVIYELDKAVNSNVDSMEKYLINILADLYSK